MEESRFQHSDAWIFISMAFYQGEASTSLRDLIATADYINHAIPTDEEIEGAINRLSSAGLVIVQEGHFHLSPAGRIILQEFHGKRTSLLKMWELVEKQLESMEFPELEVPPFKLKPEQFRTAYNSYYELISHTEKKSTRKKKPVK